MGRAVLGDVLSRGGLRVETRLRRPPARTDAPHALAREALVLAARRKLAAALRERDRFTLTDRSRAADDIRYHAWRSAIHAAADAASEHDTTWSVGGSRATFVVVATDSAWGAAAALPPRMVTVGGCGSPPTDLALVDFGAA